MVPLPNMLAFDEFGYLRSPAEQWWVVASLVIGGALLLASLFIRRAPRPVPTCPRCGFDMRGARDLRCTECGSMARSVRDLVQRRTSALAMTGFIVTTACPMGLAVRWSRDRNWSPPLPSWHCAEIIALGDGTSAQVWEHRPPSDVFNGSRVHLEQAIQLPNGARAELWRRYAEDLDDWSVNQPNEIVLVSADGRRRVLAGFQFSMSLGVARGELWKPPPGFTRRLDVTTDGHPDLVVEHYSGGAHCCVSLGIFECMPDGSFNEYFARTQDPWPDDSAGSDGPNDGMDASCDWFVHADGTLLWAMCDLLYAITCYACLDHPVVLYEVRDGALVPSPRHMREPPLDTTALDALIRAHRAADWDPAGVSLDSPWGPQSGAFDGLAGDALRLIYSGNAKQAWTLIRQSCPIDEPPFDRLYAQFLNAVIDNPLLREMQPDAWSGPEGPPPAIALPSREPSP